MKRNHPFPLLWAPPDYWTLSPEQRKDICNGCGPRGILGVFIPNYILGVSIRAACDIHDFMYRVGETFFDKEFADRVFRNNMLRIIEANSWFAFIKRRRAAKAEVYYQAVRKFGGPWFWKGKNDSAELGWAGA